MRKYSFENNVRAERTGARPDYFNYCDRFFTPSSAVRPANARKLHNEV